MSFFDINNIFFTFLGYSISYLEFTATVFTLLCVGLLALANIFNWVMGMIGVSLFAVLFYQTQLYSDMFLQVFFFMMNAYGLYKWLSDPDFKSQHIVTRWAPISQIIRYVILIVIGTFLMGLFMANIQNLLPSLFPNAASFPYLDSFVAVMSIGATFWQIKKKINQWLLWIILDVVAIIIYYIKNIPFVSLLYVIFLVISIKGLFNWIKLQQR